MTRTPDLIDALVETATPVRRLRPPIVRAGLWLAFATVVLGLIAIAHGMRPDFSDRVQQPLFVLGMLGALATSILAAVASFRLSLPDSSRLWAILPLPALALWVATIGYGCLTDWVSMGPDSVHMGEAIRCFATLFMTSVPLSIVMLVMLRYAALLTAGSERYGWTGRRGSDGICLVPVPWSRCDCNDPYMEPRRCGAYCRARQLFWTVDAYMDGFTLLDPAAVNAEP